MYMSYMVPYYHDFDLDHTFTFLIDFVAIEGGRELPRIGYKEAYDHVDQDHVSERWIFNLHVLVHFD